MKKIHIGIGPIGWANDDLRGWSPERTGEDIMQEIALSGYAGTEMSYTYPQDPAELRLALDSTGLVLASAYRWTNFAYAEHRTAEVQAACRHVDFCAAAGAHYVLLAEGSKSLHWDINGPRHHVDPFARDDWRRVCEGFNQVGEYARTQGLTMAVHPHGGTAIESDEEVADLLDGTDPQLVGYCLDTGHAVYGGSDPLVLLKRWGPRVRYVHLKDVRPDVLADVHARGKNFLEAIQSDVFGSPGEGSTDFATFLSQLSALDYEGWLVVEADQNPATHPPLEVAVEARKRLRAWLGEPALA